MIKMFLLVFALVAASMALLSVRLFFGRRFVKTHVSQSKAMRRRGIGCVQSQDKEARIEKTTRVKEKSTDK